MSSIEMIGHCKENQSYLDGFTDSEDNLDSVAASKSLTAANLSNGIKEAKIPETSKYKA